jgi:hypothetical protein
MITVGDRSRRSQGFRQPEADRRAEETHSADRWPLRLQPPPQCRWPPPLSREALTEGIDDGLSDGFSHLLSDLARQSIGLGILDAQGHGVQVPIHRMSQKLIPTFAGTSGWIISLFTALPERLLARRLALTNLRTVRSRDSARRRRG